MSKTARRRLNGVRQSCHGPDTSPGWADGPCHPSRTVAAMLHTNWEKTRPDTPAAKNQRREELSGAKKLSGAKNLTTDAETFDERAVARLVVLLDIVEKLAAQRDQLEQAAT